MQKCTKIGTANSNPDYVVIVLNSHICLEDKITNLKKKKKIKHLEFCVNFWWVCWEGGERATVSNERNNMG